MTLEITCGFEYKGFHYGWFNEELYRLPSFVGSKKYVLKKLNVIKVGKNKGYRIKRDKLTIQQIKEMTVEMIREIHILENKDIPA